MIPNKGRYTDCNPINQPPGTWREGKNFVVNHKKAAWVNEPGTDLTATAFPFTWATPIGTTVFPDGSYVVYAAGLVSHVSDRIGVVDKYGVYTDLIIDAAFNFNIEHPVQSSEIDYNAFSERITGWTDNYNAPRVLNIDRLPFPLNPDKSLVNPADINDLEVFPKFKTPIFEYTVNQTGGALLAGVYSFSVSYENLDGTKTPYSAPVEIVYIADDPASIGYDKFDGVAPGTVSSKSITLNISNVDTRYDKIVLIVVRKINQQTEALEIRKADVSGSTLTMTYVGTETTITLPIDEVITPRPLYTKVGAMTQLNSTLYLGNLESQEDIEYQSVANTITVHYNTKLVPIANINDSQKNQLPGGFTHGGVYAFYIAFKLTNGSWSRAFHIPGRTPSPGGTHDVSVSRSKNVYIISPTNPGTWSPSLFSEATVDNTNGYFNSSITIYNSTIPSYNGLKIVVEAGPSRIVFQHGFIGFAQGTANEITIETITTTADNDNSAQAVGAGLPSDTKTYQIEDTTNKPQPTYILDGDTYVTQNLSNLTNMGFWENQNEIYPVGFPMFAGQRVRHHVFPTIRKCKQIHYSGVAGYGRDQFDILGIDVANVVIPPHIADKVEGWGIFYADRSYVNSNVLGNDLWLLAHRGNNAHPDYIWSAGGNWHTESYAGDGPWEEDFDPNPDYIRGHNFELLKDKPTLSVGSLFLDFELKIRKENLLGSFLDIGKAGGNLAKSGEDEGQNAGAVIDLTDTLHTTVTLTPSLLIRAIEEYKYLPTGIVDGNIMTLKNEEIIHLKPYQNANIPYLKSEAHVNSSGRDPGVFIQNVAGFANGGEDTYLITYKQVKSDVYNQFDSQVLCLTDTISLPSEPSKRKIRGGDSFASVRSFISMSPRHTQDYEKVHGTTVIRAHITESRYNIGLRYETLGDVTTRYYPKTPAQNFWNNPSDPDENGVDMIFDRTQNPNGLSYSNDYNETNKYSQPVIYNVNQRTTNKFPYRVIRGGDSSGARTDINGWKTFLAADYYESNRNRGPITDLFVMDDNLFIHHYYGLFRTLGTEKLSLGTTEVYLGTGDIFSQKPKELESSKLGFLGNQNIFAGISFAGHRFWVDQKQGRVFLLNRNGVGEISKSGLYQFFRDNLKINDELPDNPVSGEGITSAYDPIYNRIILSKKSNENPFTISYALDEDQGYWAFEHDYTPDYMFFTSNNFYGIKNNRIHAFNSPTRKAKYFEVNEVNSEVEIIFNLQPNKNKKIYNVNWISEVLDQSSNLLANRTLTAIRVKTTYQDTGTITLIPFTQYGNKHNIRRFKNTWNFNKLRDINGDVYKRKGLVDNWCSITFVFNNTPNLDDTQNSLYLYLLDAQANLVEL